MTGVDLEDLSLEELTKLKKDVEKAIAEFEARKRKEALEALRVAAKEHGFSLDELTSGTTLKKGKAPKNPPKYAHPGNAELTWSGRGRQPKWLKEALQSGKSLKDFAI